MRVRSVLTAAMMAIAAPSTVWSAEFPKAGEAQIDTALTYKVTAVSDVGDAKATIFEGSGIARDHSGEGPFQLMALHCLGHATIVKSQWRGNGSCAWTDKDGDSILSSWAYSNDSGGSSLVGGTGKYQGITGTTNSRTDGHVYDDPLRGWATVGHINVKWEVK
jgi:hypothetical protein